MVRNGRDCCREFDWLKGLLDVLTGPMIVAANHQSHFDTPVILTALPGRCRRTVAMAKEYFDAHFFPERYPVIEHLVTSAIYYLVTLFFNAFPLPQTEPGAKHTLRYIGELVTDGFSILIFPEGHRTERGEIRQFQSGVGILGSKLRVPVVPVRLEGVERVLHHTWRWPRRGHVRVTFGAPLVLEGNDSRRSRAESRRRSSPCSRCRSRHRFAHRTRHNEMLNQAAQLAITSVMQEKPAKRRWVRDVATVSTAPPPSAFFSAD